MISHNNFAAAKKTRGNDQLNCSASKNELYCEIYRSAQMGTESILTLLPKVENESQRADMTLQMNGYGKFAERAKSGLTLCNARAEEEKRSKVLAAKAGISAETMFDSSTSHIAELMIRGSGADIISITRAQNQALHGKERIPQNDDAYMLSFELIDFENRSIDNMKKYL